QQIADMAGVAMPQPDPQAEQREKERMGLVEVMDMATRFFEDHLQTPAGAKARAYLRDRGLTGRTIETFRLGFAPESRNALKEHLAGKGVPKEAIEACGLVVHGPEIPVSYDRFRDRIMFPILSIREKVIAFGGRAMSPDAPAKYLNSNETELFHKGGVLYNHARARKGAQGADGPGTIIAVEGYMDVIALHQVGIENAVAPLGTALTENQLELLWKMTPEPVLCFDGDGAGIRAANRAADLALPFIKPERTVRFALLPDGKDPDDLVRHEGRAPFDKVMASARPLAEMIWSREVQGVNFDTPESRAALEARLRQVTAVIADEDVRRHYQQNMRDRLNTFFRPVQRQGSGNFSGNRQGKGGARNAPQGNAAPTGVSDRLMRSALVRGAQELPALRESVLALTVVNHPGLLFSDYDEIAIIEYENRDLQRLWSALIGIAGAIGARLERDRLIEELEAAGFDTVLKTLEQQVRNSRLWTATVEAAPEDAREGYLQALALHKRTRALLWQRRELERELAVSTEEGDGERVPQILRALQEVQQETVRLENQEAIIEGFGVLSGRVKGPAAR
ncbi:MAG: DNA primase, partial [Shinella sp.]